MAVRCVAILTLLFTLATPGAYAHADSPLTPLRFLLGDWVAIGTSPGERGGFTFQSPCRIASWSAQTTPNTPRETAVRHPGTTTS